MKTLVLMLLVCAIIMVACSPKAKTRSGQNYYGENNTKRMQKINQKQLWQGKKMKKH